MICRAGRYKDEFSKSSPPQLTVWSCGSLTEEIYLLPGWLLLSWIVLACGRTRGVVRYGWNRWTFCCYACRDLTITWFSMLTSGSWYSWWCWYIGDDRWMLTTRAGDVGSLFWTTTSRGLPLIDGGLGFCLGSKFCNLVAAWNRTMREDWLWGWQMTR